MTQSGAVNWTGVKVVIFDVDGTLYNQKGLRKRMLFSLLSYYFKRPHRYRELMILKHFRSERERLSSNHGPDLQSSQYHWCANKGGYPLSLVRKTVDHWIFDYPNQFLKRYMFPGVASFFRSLRSASIKTAIYSDYAATTKMAAMDLHPDLVVSSTDPGIDKLKPNPKALFHIARHFGVQPSECLFIGDREDLDGACAAAAGMPFLLVDKEQRPFQFYTELEHQLKSTLNLTNHGTHQPARA